MSLETCKQIQIVKDRSASCVTLQPVPTIPAIDILSLVDMASAAPSNATSSTVVLDPAILHANVTRVLVSGATGYIAGHVVANLLEHGLKVRGTVRNVANTKKYAHLTVRQWPAPSLQPHPYIGRHTHTLFSPSSSIFTGTPWSK